MDREQGWDYRSPIASCRITAAGSCPQVKGPAKEHGCWLRFHSGKRERISMKENPKAGSKPLNKLKILFADDEQHLQQLMSNELPRMGHEVTVCPDGHTAVAALELNTYDCIIVDLDMPGMNGIEVISKCKELSPETDAVVLTGKGSFDTAVQALKHGAVDYLTKPCKLIDLKALLARVAKQREWLQKVRALTHQLQRAEGKTELVGH